MPFLFTTILRYLILPGSFTGLTIVSGSILFAADPAIQNASRLEEKSETPTRGFTARNRSKSGTSRDWSRTIGRPVPVGAGQSTELTPEPRIRFASASGVQDGEVTTATESHENSNDLQTAPESDQRPATPSLTVKEQLLQALRARREATLGTPETATKPGTLTILHSPHTKPETVVNPLMPSTAAPTESPASTPPDSTIDKQPESINTATPAPESPGTVESPVGLTRTLEADLHSDDPYIRERAQRYLRLEMQLLQLRASQAAAAELPAPHADQPAPEPAEEPRPNDAEAAASPSAPPAAVSDPESHVTPNASMMENMVVDGPIDRLGLANNLFAVGQYPLALEMYQQASTEILPAHQAFWVEYQTANCIRRLGRPGEASLRYRKLASKPEAGWLSRQAQWWCETLEKIRVLESTLADNSIDRHRATVEESEAGTPPHENSSPPAEPIHPPEKESQHDANAQ
jgi:hypothetical protein